MQKLFQLFAVVLIASLLAFPSAGVNGAVQAQEWTLPELEPTLSTDGTTLYNAVPPLIVRVDDTPEMQNIHGSGPTAEDALVAPPTATFNITYVAAGGTDLWGQVCVAFPTAAKTAFQAAANIWATKLQSSVPITIKACWANLGSSSILGYSGGQPSHTNFSGAPKTNTWYQGSLANSIAGSDLAASSNDMNITYNSGFSWYYGTDGATPVGQYDLVTVAAHEIGHGLNFSGTASYSSGTGYYGDNTYHYPNVYDTFAEDNAGSKMTVSYTSGTAALGTLLTSGSLWFNGTNANAANGGARVKLYAPGTWAPGSSYAHLDYATFAGTSNSMMVYAVSSGSSQHAPGTVTLGMFKDMGWKMHVASTTATPVLPAGKITDRTPTYKWTSVKGATAYQYQLYQGTTRIYAKNITPAGVCGSLYCTNTPTTNLAYGYYKWRVRAQVGGVWSAWSAFKAFSVITTKPKAGYWQGGSGGVNWMEFYVTPNQSYVDNFAIYINVPACGNYKIMNLNYVTISSLRKFAFSGAFYANGTIASNLVSASGTAGLNMFPIAGCGNVNGGPWSWAATWKNTSQPSAAGTEVEVSPGVFSITGEGDYPIATVVEP